MHSGNPSCRAPRIISGRDMVAAAAIAPVAGRVRSFRTRLDRRVNSRQDCSKSSCSSAPIFAQSVQKRIVLSAFPRRRPALCAGSPRSAGQARRLAPPRQRFSFVRPRRRCGAGRGTGARAILRSPVRPYCPVLHETGLLPRVIEGRPEQVLNLCLSPDAPNPPEDAPRGGVVAGDGHEVGERHHALRQDETRLQDVRVGDISNGGFKTGRGSYRKAAAFPGIQNRRENGWRFQIGEAAPVDGTVSPDKGAGLQIADNPVFLELLILCFFRGAASGLSAFRLSDPDVPFFILRMLSWSSAHFPPASNQAVYAVQQWVHRIR